MLSLTFREIVTEALCSACTPHTDALFICDSLSGAGHYSKWWAAPIKGDTQRIAKNVKGKFASMWKWTNRVHTCRHWHFSGTRWVVNPKHSHSLLHPNQDQPHVFIYLNISAHVFAQAYVLCIHFFHPLTKKHFVCSSNMKLVIHASFLHIFLILIQAHILWLLEKWTSELLNLSLSFKDGFLSGCVTCIT